jgi:hypothetical protein
MTARHLLPAWNGLASIVLVVNSFFTYAGVEVNAVHVDELRNPAREYPKSIFLAMALVLAVFIGPTLAISWVIPSAQISFTAGVMQAFNSLFTHFGVVAHDRDHLPDVFAGPEQPGAAARRAVSEPDQRMLIHTQALLDVPLREGPRRQVDTPGAGAQAAACPQADGARGHVQLAVAQCPLQPLGRHRGGRIMQVRVVLIRPLADPRREPSLARVGAHGVDQVIGPPSTRGRGNGPS